MFTEPRTAVPRWLEATFTALEVLLASGDSDAAGDGGEPPCPPAVEPPPGGGGPLPVVVVLVVVPAGVTVMVPVISGPWIVQ
jgi:hypothetical protein